MVIGRESNRMDVSQVVVIVVIVVVVVVVVECGYSTQKQQHRLTDTAQRYSNVL